MERSRYSADVHAGQRLAASGIAVQHCGHSLVDAGRKSEEIRDNDRLPRLVKESAALDHV
jgi:hypothetical protein